MYRGTAHDTRRLLQLAFNRHHSHPRGLVAQSVVGTLQLKQLGDVCKGLSRVNAGFGTVRLRKQVVSTEWRVELFGAAQPL